jgi:hypothetical protein
MSSKAHNYLQEWWVSYIQCWCGSLIGGVTVMWSCGNALGLREDYATFFMAGEHSFYVMPPGHETCKLFNGHGGSQGDPNHY